MLTSYLVTCPYFGCDWFGSLLPKGDVNAWRGGAPSLSEVEFVCPRCERVWHARVVGDDVEPLPVDEGALHPV